MAVLGQILRASLSRYVVALEFPEFRTMWMANLAAQAAAWALIVSRGWLVFDMTRSSFAVALVTFAAMVPQLFMPPIAGVLADRMSRRDLMGITYGVNLLTNLVLAILAATGVIVEWQVIVLSVINGAARATQQSTSQALAANLVPEDRLLNALSLSASTQHLARLVGPGLATPLLGFLGAPAAFFLCTSLYAVGWYLIMQIKNEARGGASHRESMLFSFKEGLRFAWRQPYIRMVLAMVFFHCGLTMAFESLLPTFAHQQFSVATAAAPPVHVHEGGGEFNSDATGFSTLVMGVGVGALFGGLFVGGIQSSLARGRLYLVMGVMSGLGQVLLSVSPNMAFAFFAAAIMGGSQAAFMTMGQATMQALAVNEYRGRIASLNSLSLGGVMSLMNLANGYLGTQFSAAEILLAQGLLYVIIMVVSIGFTLPRSVYRSGLPSRPTALATA